jgi:hypothetical protein
MPAELLFRVQRNILRAPELADGRAKMRDGRERHFSPSEARKSPPRADVRKMPCPGAAAPAARRTSPARGAFISVLVLAFSCSWALVPVIHQR